MPSGGAKWAEPWAKRNGQRCRWPFVSNWKEELLLLLFVRAFALFAVLVALGSFHAAGVVTSLAILGSLGAATSDFAGRGLLGFLVRREGEGGGESHGERHGSEDFNELHRLFFLTDFVFNYWSDHADNRHRLRAGKVSALV